MQTSVPSTRQVRYLGTECLDYDMMREAVRLHDTHELDFISLLAGLLTQELAPSYHGTIF